MVGFKLRVTSLDDARKLFGAEKEKILSLITGVSEELASTRILIPRLRGMEDSSRFWSLYMVLEHLRIVNHASTEIISTLLAGASPKIEASTASVKPGADIDETVVGAFIAGCEKFEGVCSTEKNFKTTHTLAHPWFGELNAQQWHFFAGFHMALHRKQILKILEGLDLL